MRAVGIIPARFDSQRFPGKVLADIAGIPMLERVVRGARRSSRLREVLVATDDPRVARLAERIGAGVVMTSRHHPCGTDRVAEAAASLSDDVVVNIQGDEPLVEPFVIDAALAALESDPGVDMATVAHPAEGPALDDPNRVKVVIDRRGRAIYFSRARIPYAVHPEAQKGVWQHAGLYAYRRAFLARFVELPRGDAERAEGLEQLRALEHGHAIAVARVEGWQSRPVDVPADIARVEALLGGSRDTPGH